ncbi:MAG: rhomboid family intramembrane serine protease [Flammeovirgaceae bacterium]|nr:rhomboid family intramembrane serine protease [Flammeovirgaceae bacterium]
MFNRLTPVVRNLIFINVIVFIGQQIAPLHLTELLSLWNVRSEYFKPYQLFTYMFAHGGFGHIFFNMLSLAFMGPILEHYWGTQRFLLFYMVTGIGAGVLSVALDLFFGIGTFGIMMGASGAVYGILMGFGMIFPNMEIQLLIPPIPIKAKYLVFVLFGISLLLGGNVAHFAHLGGIIFAFILIKLWRSRGGGYF